MKKTIFIALLLLSIQIGNAQLIRSIEFMMSIDNSYRSLSLETENEFTESILLRRQTREIPKLSSRLGFTYNQRLAKTLSLKSGLRIARIGYQDKKQTDLRWPSEVDINGDWTPDSSLPRELKQSREYWFLEIPVILRTEFGTKKWRPLIELGAAPMVYLTTKSKSITDIDTSVNFSRSASQNFNTIQVTGILSVGLSYMLSKGFQIYGQPTLRYHFTKLVDAPIKEHLYSYGIEFGFRTRINWSSGDTPKVSF